MADRVCIECNDCLARKGSSYCNSCFRDRHRRQYHGDTDAIGRVCESCGDRYPGHGTSTLCVKCRTDPATEKTCTKCGKKFRSYKDRHMRCGACRRKQAEYVRGLYRDHYRQVRVDKTFNLDPGQFGRMLEEQGNRCLICGQEFADLSEVEDMRKAGLTVPYVDHDHRCCDFNPSVSRPLCGKCIRGLVCRRCNVLLGHAEDSVEILQAAIDYIRRWAAAGS